MNHTLNKIDRLIDILESCCNNLPVNPDEIIQNLLNESDQEDIISGDIPERTVKKHIEIWCSENKPTIN